MSLMFGAGVLWDNSVGAAFGEQWVIFTGVMLATPVVLVVTVLFITETPYYLVIRGKEEKAAESLEWLRGPGSGNVKAELQSIKTTVEEEKKIGRAPIRHLLSKKVYSKPLLIMLALMFFRQFAGVKAIMMSLQVSKITFNVKPDH